MIDKMAPSKPSVEDSDEPKFPFPEPREYQNRLLIIGRTISSKACLLWLQVQVKH